MSNDCYGNWIDDEDDYSHHFNQYERKYSEHQNLLDILKIFKDTFSDDEDLEKKTHKFLVNIFKSHRFQNTASEFISQIIMDEMVFVKGDVNFDLVSSTVTDFKVSKTALRERFFSEIHSIATSKNLNRKDFIKLLPYMATATMNGLKITIKLLCDSYNSRQFVNRIFKNNTFIQFIRNEYNLPKGAIPFDHFKSLGVSHLGMSTIIFNIVKNEKDFDMWVNPKTTSPKIGNPSQYPIAQPHFQNFIGGEHGFSFYKKLVKCNIDSYVRISDKDFHRIDPVEFCEEMIDMLDLIPKKTSLVMGTHLRVLSEFIKKREHDLDKDLVEKYTFRIYTINKVEGNSIIRQIPDKTEVITTHKKL